MKGKVGARARAAAGHLIGDASRYIAVRPPSTGAAKPVTNEASSEHSHSTAAAISSGRPIRPTGCAAPSCAWVPPAAAAIRSVIGVRIPPGQTALTLTLFLASCSAADLVNPTTPCLDAP